jgi:hypothetical protein
MPLHFILHLLAFFMRFESAREERVVLRKRREIASSTPVSYSMDSDQVVQKNIGTEIEIEGCVIPDI